MRNKFGTNPQIIINITHSICIIKSDFGYFWLDKRKRLWSGQFFNTELEVINNL